MVRRSYFEECSGSKYVRIHVVPDAYIHILQIRNSYACLLNACLDEQDEAPQL